MRWAGSRDHDALGATMRAAILAGPSPYPPAHRRAWADALSGPRWPMRLAAQDVAASDALDGFVSLAPGGEVDLAFIRVEARGRGMLRLLHGEIVARARQAGHARLVTHASLAAEAPFAAMGWRVAERQVVEIGRLRFRRAAMTLAL